MTALLVGGNQWSGVEGIGVVTQGRDGGGETIGESGGHGFIRRGEVGAGGGLGAVHGAGDVEIVEVVEALEDPGFLGLA